MSSLLTDPPSLYHASQLTRPGATFTETEGGLGTLQNLHSFRSGTFMDANRVERTWTPEDMQAMASNFGKLRDAGILPNIPVRADHGRSANDVVGYLTDVRADGEDLLCDVEFTEPEAAAKWVRGTYRSRSLEVGSYIDNDANLYSPVVLGLAFVDLPAVEGLYSSPHVGKEGTAPVTENETTAWEDAANYAQALADEEKAKAEEAEFLIAAEYAAAIELAQGNNHANGLPPHQFTLGGRQVANYAEVQAAIDALEAFQSDTQVYSRHVFVEELAASSRIAASQVDSMKALVTTLDETGFAAFSASYEAAPSAPLFYKHGATGGEPLAPNDDTADRIAVLEETLKFTRAAGLDEAAVKATASYQELTALKAVGA